MITLLAILLVVPNALAEMSVLTGTRFDLFTTDGDPETVGYEVTFPVGLTYTWRDFTLAVNTAYGSANVYPGSGSSSSIDSITDMRVAATYGIKGLPVGLFAGVELNVPSGTERLGSVQRLAEAGQNHDIFEVDDFGKGFDAIVSLGVADTFGPFSLAVNTRYRNNGEYDPTTDRDDDDIDPGDQILLDGLLKWKLASLISLDASAAHVIFSEDRVNGSDAFQEGPKTTIGGRLWLNTHIHRPVRLAVGLQSTIQGKNKILGVDNSLETESQNSNGRELFAQLNLLYESSPRLALRMVGDLRHYGESPRKDTETDRPYTGQRVRYAFGPGVMYTPGKRIVLQSLVKYFVMTRERDILTPDETTYRGVNLSVGITYKFLRKETE